MWKQFKPEQVPALTQSFFEAGIGAGISYQNEQERERHLVHLPDPSVEYVYATKRDFAIAMGKEPDFLDRHDIEPEEEPLGASMEGLIDHIIPPDLDRSLWFVDLPEEGTVYIVDAAILDREPGS